MALLGPLWREVQRLYEASGGGRERLWGESVKGDALDPITCLNFIISLLDQQTKLGHVRTTRVHMHKQKLWHCARIHYITTGEPAHVQHRSHRPCWHRPRSRGDERRTRHWAETHLDVLDDQVFQDQRIASGADTKTFGGQIDGESERFGPLCIRVGESNDLRQ